MPSGEIVLATICSTIIRMCSVAMNVKDKFAEDVMGHNEKENTSEDEK